MILDFIKMNGLGNDYIFFNALECNNLTSTLFSYIPQLSDRHFGIGGDGVIIIESSMLCDCRMRMFNADGSEAAMCGNGIRELAKLVWEKNWIKKNPLIVETGNGNIVIHMDIRDDKMFSATVEMGYMDFDFQNTYFISQDKAQTQGISTFLYPYKGEHILFYVGNIGSKHATCFLSQDIEKTVDFCSIGKSIECNKNIFPDGINVEFVNIISPTQVLMRVWERGSGHTLACGTGATFVVGLGMKLGLLDKAKKIEVLLERGSLFISQKDDGMMIMEGNADLVYEGTINLNQFNI